MHERTSSPAKWEVSICINSGQSLSYTVLTRSRSACSLNCYCKDWTCSHVGVFAAVGLSCWRRHAARSTSFGRRSEAKIPNCHCFRRRPRLSRTRPSFAHDAWCAFRKQQLLRLSCQPVGFHPGGDLPTNSLCVQVPL